MADASDVEAALVAICDSVRVTTGASWSIYRGSPTAAALDPELARGDIHVTVAQREGFYRNTTRWPVDEIALPSTPASLTASLSGTTATFAGTCSTDQIAGVQIGATGYAYRCAANDTPASVAAALTTATGGVASGSTLTAPGLVAARTARDGATLRLTRQQEVQFEVCIWCSDPLVRDAVAGQIDAALSDVTFLQLPDQSQGRMRGAGSRSTDRAQNANLYRRDLYYSVDYSTTIRMGRTPVLFPGGTLHAQGAGTPLGVNPPVVSIQVDVNGNPIIDAGGNLVGGYA